MPILTKSSKVEYAFELKQLPKINTTDESAQKNILIYV